MIPYVVLGVLIGLAIGVHRRSYRPTPGPEPRRHVVPTDVLASRELPTMATAFARDVLAAHTAALLVGDPRFDEAEHTEAVHYMLIEQWLDAGRILDDCQATLARPHSHWIDRVPLDNGRSLVTHGVEFLDGES